MPIDPNMRVLVVDDYRVMARIVHRMLGAIGLIDIDVADDARSALAMLEGERYGLLVGDINLEGMSGLDLARAIRASDKDPDLPVVMYTARTTPGTIAEACAAGVSACLAKPFNEAALRRSIEDALTYPGA